MYKYEKISQTLRKKIMNHELQPGVMLPDQNQLAKEFNTTRITISKAIQILIIEGLVYSKRGAGTFVRKDVQFNNDFNTDVDKPLGTTMTHPNKKITSKHIHLTARIATKDEQEHLLLEDGETVYVIKRTRLIDGKPFSYEQTIMPTKIATITKEILQKSVYEYLQKEHHLEFAGSHRQIMARKVSDEDVHFLGEKKGDPILVISQVNYLVDGTPFEYSESHFPYQNSVVSADIKLEH
ncbi:UTRA domain-containing protein [Pediococcus acidilactici]|uniref:GntR family transcriptional regulator n=1 Tax=Pediococcus acidilactici TaxID=1254 RepID=UPI0013292B10|nr:GntR family transcriptional regulator [Pediococcus acidilactici]KAF0372399.1 UTRA domain-containing protein [Pediococcus acidilactici]KAF0391475.1 UTRA domain-containing protein [Pediococcus acidilactici]